MFETCFTLESVVDLEQDFNSSIVIKAMQNEIIIF